MDELRKHDAWIQESQPKSEKTPQQGRRENRWEECIQVEIKR